METKYHKITYSKTPMEVIEENARICIKGVLGSIELTFDIDRDCQSHQVLRKNVLDAINEFKRKTFDVVDQITTVNEIVLADSERKLEGTRRVTYNAGDEEPDGS